MTEGTSIQKLARIQHSGLLNRAYRSFASISGKLFIYGHSLASNDDHLLELVEDGSLKAVFVGLYGDPNSSVNRAIVERANRFSNARRKHSSTDVFFFDSASAHVWDGIVVEGKS